MDTTQAPSSISQPTDRAASPSAAPRADFDREVIRHRAELVGAGIRMTGSRAEAEDLVQEAVMRAWVFWHRFEPGTNGRAWMHRILLNTFINGYRRRRRERDVLQTVHAQEMREQWDAQASDTPGEALGDEVQAALDALPEEFRRVVVLVDLEERSYRDAADAIGCPIGTVMSRLHRARRAMKRDLEQYAEHAGMRAVTPSACEPQRPEQQAPRAAVASARRIASRLDQVAEAA
jgi:RNA polymerase sigma-70 factor (ECF subfamily)